MGGGVMVVADIPFHLGGSTGSTHDIQWTLWEHFQPRAFFYDMVKISWNPAVIWRAFENIRMLWSTPPYLLQVMGPKDL